MLFCLSWWSITCFAPWVSYRRIFALLGEFMCVYVCIYIYTHLSLSLLYKTANQKILDGHVIYIYIYVAFIVKLRTKRS